VVGGSGAGVECDGGLSGTCPRAAYRFAQAVRRIEEREGTCSTVHRSNTLRHSFLAEVFCIRVPRLVKAARTCAAKRSRALTSLGTRCDFAARKECLGVFASG